MQNTKTILSEKETIEIKGASIKEELCNYGYEIITGPGTGDKVPSHKGSSIVHRDMIKAFGAMNVHLAVIYDAFNFPADRWPTLDQLEDDEIISRFTVTGFKVLGSEENEGYVLVGEKSVSMGTIEINTPKISKSSGYRFYDDLKEAIDLAKIEVDLYMNGKAAPKVENDYDLNEAAEGLDRLN